MRYVIVGAGPAGVAAAETIRQLDPAGAITIIGDEPEPPYSRMAIPYFLTGKVGEAGTHLRPDPDHFERLNIAHVRQKVAAVDTAASHLRLEDGGTVDYDRLLICSGARPIRPPIAGLTLPGVHSCWTLEDARAIAARATPGARVVLIGAGFVGTIVLEALAIRNIQLTVIETGDRMVPRMMDEVAGNMLRRWCEAKGVRVLTSTHVEAIEAAGPPPAKPGLFARLFGRGAAAPKSPELNIRLTGGEAIPADLVVVSAGVRPNVEFLEGSGVAQGQGVLVDDHLRTNVPGVFAAGDVCQSRDMLSGEFHVHAIQPTATEHGRVAGHNMVGHDVQFVGSLNMNVLDTLGLISTSFGAWQGTGGESARMVDEDGWRYLRLDFDGDRLIGAQAVGLIDNVGVLRGLIQTGTRLGAWKDVLLRHPERFADAYVGRIQT